MIYYPNYIYNFISLKLNIIITVTKGKNNENCI